MIKIADVTMTYNAGRPDEISPVRNFSLEIASGETVIINGPSGSGKSTLLNIIAGLTRPTNGAAFVEGKTVSKIPEHFAAKFRRENIGMIFQRFHLLHGMTAAENIALPLIPSGMSTSEINSRVSELLRMMDMEDRAHTPAEKLSGGEMQRAAIARALVNGPKIILADEPTANLDAALTESFIKLFRSLKADGRTIVIATHDPALTGAGIADRVIEMTKAK